MISKKEIQAIFNNGEYLSLIKVVELGEMLENHIELCKVKPSVAINPQNFRKLAIQLFYLIFNCFHKHVVPIPHPDFLRYCKEK
jgi:hypothetical protein